jgi:phenylpropionate dioxygenase-like ring-hydroxylating dioxygenase large terminal subunit
MNRNHWYIACASSQLRAAPRASRILDYDLVLFRDASGCPGALLDRCCHRGVRLSLGSIVGGALACRYHGWQYERGGKCIHIPSLQAADRIPEGVQIDSYPCCEQDGYVWVWAGEPCLATNPPPLIPGFSERRWRQGSVPMRCSALRGIENNLDWCHPYFAHPWRHGQFFATRFRGFREQCYEVRTTDHGMVVFAPATSDEQQPMPADAFVLLRFDFPDRVTATFGRRFKQVIVMHFVPTGDNTCRLEWLATRLLPFRPHLRWTPREPEIFAQDRRLLESAEPAYERTGGGFERSVAADTSTLMVRRIVGLAANGRWNRDDPSIPQRRIVRLRA